MESLQLNNGTVIGDDQLRKAQDTLRKYKMGKANLDKAIIENEDWYKLQHRRYFKDKEFGNRPSSAWLFNAVWGKHADAMDNYPEPAVLPREQSDEGTAKMLSAVLPVIFRTCNFRQTYNNAAWDKIKNGTAVYGIYWDQSLYNGLGDVSIVDVDLLDLYWEPGIRDIQDSQNIFHLALRDNDALVAEYPQLKDRLGHMPEMKQYNYDDHIDTTDKSVVVDWYYKVKTNGRTVVHYVKWVDDNILYSSQDDPQRADGYYKCDRYPFEFDILFPEKGTPAGFGMIDIARNPQEYIDKLGGDILDNASLVARPRPVVKTSANFNEEEFMDRDRHPVIHTSGDPEGIVWEQAQTMTGTYLSVLQYKVDELKETSGNRDVSQGSAANGITAASAIAALQEAGNKGSRDSNASSYNVFERICQQVIERIRQFYDIPRTFRITGEQGYEYTTITNQALQPKAFTEFGQTFVTKEPIFDIDVRAQKASPYARISQNELALQFYQLGFFNPELCDQSLMALAMMDFDGKKKVEDGIRQNGTLFQKLQQAQEMLMAAATALAEKGDPRVLQALQSQGPISNEPMPNQDVVPERKGSLAEQAAQRAREGASV